MSNYISCNIIKNQEKKRIQNSFGYKTKGNSKSKKIDPQTHTQ